MPSPSSSKHYSGRVFGPQEIERVRALIRAHPEASRQQLSYRVCEVFDWRKPDGSLKDLSCRVALLRMHREGAIELPPPSHKLNPCRSFGRRTAQAEPGPLLEAAVHELGELRLERVERKGSALWNEYIERYHYLGYKPLPGAQLRYFAYAGERRVGLLGFGAAAWKTGPRDAWIGWSREQRQRNLGAVVNNARFLVLPWVHSKNLASMFLARVAKVLPQHWQHVYGYCPVLLETFVERPRFTGTCYKAANWIYLGQTKGRGKLGPAGKQSVPIKDLWVYPLNRRFRSGANSVILVKCMDRIFTIIVSGRPTASHCCSTFRGGICGGSRCLRTCSPNWVCAACVRRGKFSAS
jgi:hypothetical protein